MTRPNKGVKLSVFVSRFLRKQARHRFGAQLTPDPLDCAKEGTLRMKADEKNLTSVLCGIQASTRRQPSSRAVA